jgi:hypothetical protein
MENGRFEAHSGRMVEQFRARLLEVSITPLTPPKWGWQVKAGEEVIAEGFENGQIKAAFEGYDAMFQLLAEGWSRWPPSTTAAQRRGNIMFKSIKRLAEKHLSLKRRNHPWPEEQLGGGDFSSLQEQPSTDDDQPLD